MAVRCGQCGRDYDITLFEFGRTIQCVCGNTVTLQHTEDDKPHETVGAALAQEAQKLAETRTFADRISSLIVGSDYPKIDIEIEKQKFREKICELFPDKAYLYDLIYEPRFRRLEAQFRDVDS